MPPSERSHRKETLCTQLKPGWTSNVTVVLGTSTKQAVGREKRALAVLGEAINKWGEAQMEGTGGSCRDSGRHEAFFDRGVIRYGPFA